MKNKGILVFTIIFFLLVNTTQLWEGKIGLFAMMTFIIMIIYFLVLLVLLIGQIFKSYSEKFKERKRLVLIGVMTFILTTSFLFPQGIINFSQFESESLFIAQREGTANCMTTLKLKANNKFIERNVCFGITEITGDYRISGDTIYFENVSLGRLENEFYDYAIIQQESTGNNDLGDLIRFENKSDTIGVALWIKKNELNK